MKNIKKCLLEVEAFLDNDSLGNNRRKAFVNAYISIPMTDIQQVLSEKCEFMGFRLIQIVEVKDVTEDNIPKEAIDNYLRFDAGFGEFHTFPTERGSGGMTKP